jgi:glycine cleavage system H lipoate-binding protein
MPAAAIDILESAGVFVAGLVARIGIFLAMAAVLVVPALVLAGAVRWAGARRRRALGLRRVGGLLFRPGVRYAPGHTWLERRRNGEAVEIGLDDLALRLLPSVTAVELPRAGSTIARGEPLAHLHGGGRAVAIPSPVAGTVVGVNASVLRDPALVKRDGYGRGWLVALSPSGAGWESLPTGDDAEAFLRGEASRLSRFLEQRLGFAAADGGELVSPAPWLVGEEGWSALVAEFLSR